MNHKTVILAEKPKQAKESYAPAFKVSKKEKTHYILEPCSTFPNGAILTWAIGHLVSPKMPKEYKSEWGKWSLDNLPIIPERFQFKVTEDKKTQFNAIKKLFNGADTIINACDSDREGSNIFYSILNMTGARNKEIKRLWINSLTVSKVREGFNNLLNNDKDILLYKEAKARQMGDWIVGMNTTQLYTLLLQKKGMNTMLSVGRVQSPTVYMVYQRQKEIDNFVTKPYYEIFGEFNHDNGSYKGKAKVKEESKDNVLDLLKEHNLADLQCKDSKIKDVLKEEKNTKSPLLHSLDTLQALGDKKWKYDPARTLEITQSLYEKKLLTYPRTDSNYITEDEFQYLSQKIEEYQALLGVSFKANRTPDKRYVDGSKVEEHYAIIPTDEIPSGEKIEGLTEDEKNIYYEVLKTTLAMFHELYKYEETTIITDVKGLEFFTKGKVELAQGWKMLFKGEKETTKKDDDKEENNVLPAVLKDNLVSAKLNIKEGHTTPPKPLTEGQLGTLMKTAGKLVDNEDESNILKKVKGIGTVATRGEIIKTIKNNGYIETKNNVIHITEKGKILAEAIDGTLLSSPSMTAKWEGYLEQIGEGNGTQENFVRNIEKFVNATIEQAPKQFVNANIDKAMNEHQESLYMGSCPSCKKGKIIDLEKFYGCTEYKNGCKFSINKKVAHKSLTKKNVTDLLTKGKTAKVKGLKSNKGKPFEAILSFDEQFKIKFEFK